MGAPGLDDSLSPWRRNQKPQKQRLRRVAFGPANPNVRALAGCSGLAPVGCASPGIEHCGGVSRSRKTAAACCCMVLGSSIRRETRATRPAAKHLLDTYLGKAADFLRACRTDQLSRFFPPLPKKFPLRRRSDLKPSTNSAPGCLLEDGDNARGCAGRWVL